MNYAIPDITKTCQVRQSARNVALGLLFPPPGGLSVPPVLVDSFLQPEVESNVASAQRDIVAPKELQAVIFVMLENTLQNLLAHVKIV